MNLKDLIDKGVEFLTSKKMFYVLLFLSIITIVQFLIYPTYYNVDSGIYTNPSYHFMEGNGLSNAPCFEYGDEKSFWQPPLWFVLSGIVYSIFGFNFVTMHILPLLFLIIFLVLAYYYLPSKYKIIGMSLILSLSIINTGITNRPDVLMGVFALIIVFSQNLYIISLFTGAILLTHTIGLPIAIYAFIKILLKKNIKNVIIFCGIVLLVTSPFIIYVLSDYENFFTQIIGNNYQGTTQIMKYLENIVFLFFLPLIIILPFQLKLKWEKVFCVLLILYLVFFTTGLPRFFKYGIIVTPFILFNLNFNKHKSILALVILLNFLLLSFNLVTEIYSITISDSIYTCMNNYNEIDSIKPVGVSTGYFCFNPNAKCSNDEERHMGILRHMKYKSTYNSSGEYEKICHIERFDYREFKYVDYSFVMVEN